MSCVLRNKIEIRRRALLEAVRFCGGVTALSKHLKVSRSRASNWVNQPEIEMPYEYALIAEDITQVSIERLSPSMEIANKVIRRLRAKDSPSPISMKLSEIQMGDHTYLKWQKSDRPIFVGTDGVLISGLMQVEICKASGTKQTPVLLLDLEALLLKKRFMQDFKVNLLISEEIAIGLRLESLLGDHQGRRNDLKLCPAKNESILLPTWEEVKGRKDIKVAKIIGYSTNTYYRAKQVYLKGTPELIAAMDRKEISIAVAAKKTNTTNFQGTKVQITAKGDVYYEAEN